MLGGLIVLIIAISLLPFLLLGRRTFADDSAVKKLLDTDRINEHRRIYVTKDVMEKYKQIFSKKERPHELLPISLSKKGYRRAVEIKDEFKISEETAKLVVASNKCLLSKILLTKEVPERLRKNFKRIKFEKI